MDNKDADTLSQQAPVGNIPHGYPTQPPVYSQAPADPAPPQVAPLPGYASPPPGCGVGSPPGYKQAPIYVDNRTPIIFQPPMINQQLGRYAVTCTCPKCHEYIVTNTESFNGSMVWLICLFIVFVGGWILLLCFIPFCIEDLKDVRHSCPKCAHVIGEHKRDRSF